MTTTSLNFPQLLHAISASTAIQKRTFWATALETKSYGQLLETVEQLTAHFERKGLRAGDRALLSTTHEFDTAVLFIALLANGIAVIQVDPDVKQERVHAIVEKSEVDAFILDAERFEEWNLPQDACSIAIKHEKSRKGVLFNKLMKNKAATDSPARHYPAILQGAERQKLPASIGPEQLAYILFTSGTTSETKGVMITHGNLCTHLETLSRTYGLSGESRLLNPLMLYHADGMIQGPILALATHATLYRSVAFHINHIGQTFDAIYKYKITHFVAVPTMLSLMHRFSDGYTDSFTTGDFKCIISVSSHIEVKLWQEFEKTFNTQIVNVYGLTETVAWSLFCGPAEELRKVGTVGRPVDCEAKVVDEAGHAVTVGSPGELWLKGDHVMLGYLKAPEATAEVMQDGWLASGDIAICDAEGFFRITGRKKNVVVSGGILIHPEEITECLNAHPDVDEAVSFGVADEVWGENIVSCIVRKGARSLGENDVIEFCRNHLEHNKLPTKVYFLDELPKGLSGKVKLQALRAQLENYAPEVASSENSNALAMVMTAAADAFKTDATKLSREDTPATIEGWDSLAHLDFITRLEAAMGSKFTTGEIMWMDRLAAAETLVNQRLSKP